MLVSKWKHGEGRVEAKAVALQGSGLHWVWSRLTLVDQIFILYFIALGILIAVFRARVPEWRTELMGHSVVIVLIMSLALTPGRDIRFLHAWYPLAIFIPAFEETARLSHMIVPHWQDEYLLQFEAWLFSVPPTVWSGQFATPWLTELLEFGYFSYYLLMIIAGGVLYRIGNRLAFARLMSASVLAYVICYMMFIAIPMEGPQYTLRAFHTVELTGGPFHWAVSTLQSYAGVHGNAFPSAHVANAVICLIIALVFVRRLGVALIPAVFLLCVGAIYDRYHYFSDVVAGAMLGLVVALFILSLPDTFFSDRALQ